MRESIREIQKRFVAQYWGFAADSDIVGVGIGANDTLVVMLKTGKSQESLPTEFEGALVQCKVTGEIRAL